MKARRIVSALSVIFVVSLVTSLALAGKKAPKLYPEVKPDKALVYACSRLRAPSLSQAPTMVKSRGFAWVCLDNKPFAGMIRNKKECTYEHVEPGQHFLWNTQSSLLEPLLVSVVDMNFEPGETYYFDIATATTLAWGDSVTTSFRLLDEEAGKTNVELAESFSTYRTSQFPKKCENKFADFGLNNANNGLIAASRLQAAQAMAKAFEGGNRQSATQDYDSATQLFEEAASKFDELAGKAWTRKANAIIGLSLLSPYISFKAPRTIGDVAKEYEQLAAEARRGQAECQRLLACYEAPGDDAAVARCIAKEVSGE